ncbi:MAG TPA: MBL fold metallo-hydrolase [Blastocatellia bacterium]|nr:MBL fold metallo-hydrolase [Blastocatellia bacterium]
MKRCWHVALVLFAILIFRPLGTATESASGFHARNTEATVKMTYLGNAGWEITDGKTTILLDPYLSRIRYSKREADIAGDNRPTYFDSNDRPEPDTAVIDAHIKRADYVLLSHGHFDHMMDVPYILKKTGANLIATEANLNVAYAYGVNRQQLIPAQGGDDYDFGAFSVKVIPSLHGALIQKRYVDSDINPDNIKTPLRLIDYHEGGTLAFLIRFHGHQILSFGSMNYIENELKGLKPDVVLVGAKPERNEIYDYMGRLMRVLSYPPLVMPNHWDDFFLPYWAPQDRALKQLDSFIAEVKKASPTTKVIVGKHFQPIILPDAPVRKVRPTVNRQ